MPTYVTIAVYGGDDCDPILGHGETPEASVEDAVEQIEAWGYAVDDWIFDRPVELRPARKGA